MLGLGLRLREGCGGLMTGDCRGTEVSGTGGLCLGNKLTLSRICFWQHQLEQSRQDVLALNPGKHTRTQGTHGSQFRAPANPQVPSA